MDDHDHQPTPDSDAVAHPVARPAGLITPTHTVYDDIRRVLLDHGLAHGCEHNRRGQLGLIGATETAVEHSSHGVFGRSSQGARLARQARIARHLRALATTSHLGAWTDGRTLDDILELLTLATIAHPDD